MGNKPEAPLSKAAAKNKKRKEAAKRAAMATDPGAKPPSVEQKDALSVAREHHKEYQGAKGMLADPEKEKKIRKLNDKLTAIKKLKDKVAAGESLEKNQLDKLAK